MILYFFVVIKQITHFFDIEKSEISSMHWNSTMDVNKEQSDHLYTFLKELYVNDGFIYCIDTKFIDADTGKRCVKIGKTGCSYTNYKKTCQSEFEDALLRRYKTSYPKCRVMFCVRVGDRHKAEKATFDKLEDLLCVSSHELYYLDEDRIKAVLDDMSNRFPHIDTVIQTISVDELTSFNTMNRIEQQRSA